MKSLHCIFERVHVNGYRNPYVTFNAESTTGTTATLAFSRIYNANSES